MIRHSDTRFKSLDLLSRIPGLSWAWGTFLIARNRAAQLRLIRVMGRHRSICFRECIFDFDFASPHDAQVFNSIQEFGAYEPETTEAIFSHLRQGDLFVDVGANSGYYSILAARLVGKPGKVLAIEPSSAPFARLQRNIEVNGFGDRIQAVCAAASDHNGETTLFINPWDDGWTSTIQPTRIAARVKTVAVDDVTTPQRRVTVKIDVEGGELDVLRGMQRLIHSVPDFALVVEWNRKYATTELRRFLFDRFNVNRLVMSATGFQRLPISEIELKRGITLSNLWCQKLTPLPRH